MVAGSALLKCGFGQENMELDLRPATVGGDWFPASWLQNPQKKQNLILTHTHTHTHTHTQTYNFSFFCYTRSSLMHVDFL